MEINENYFEDIGKYNFKVTTESDDCQLWVNRGMMMLYGFNLEDSHNCFLKALSYDEKCVFAHWGAAYSSGPHYNFVRVSAENHAVSISHLKQAFEKISKGYIISEIEKDLLIVLQSRYQEPMPIEGPEYQECLTRYAKTFRPIYEKYCDNNDVASLYAEAVMILRPWKLWSKDGKPFEEAVEVEKVLIKAKNNTHVYHLFIHLYELSPQPSLALEVANELLEKSVEISHHNHMPSHIFGLLGMYEKAIYANRLAIKNSYPSLKRVGKQAYYMFYHCHNIHFIIHQATLIGDYDLAVENMNLLLPCLEGVEKFVAYNKRTIEFYHIIDSHIKVRFGKWQEIIDTPLVTPYEDKKTGEKKFYVVLTLQKYARTIAYAVLDKVKEAEQELFEFRELVKELNPDIMLYTNTIHDVLAVADSMAEGELLYRKKDYDKAFEKLRLSAQLNDDLVYGEPWSWPQPPRHALGALLLEQGHVDESIEVYKKDLLINPKNIWSLTGLYDCYQQKEIDVKEKENIYTQLQEARKLSKHQVKASCFCKKNSC